VELKTFDPDVFEEGATPAEETEVAPATADSDAEKPSK